MEEFEGTEKNMRGFKLGGESKEELELVGKQIRDVKQRRDNEGRS